MKKKINKKVVNYDAQADVLALYLKEGIPDDSIEISPGISVELAKNGSVIGIEILNASKVLHPFVRSMRRKETMVAAR